MHRAGMTELQMTFFLGPVHDLLPYLIKHIAPCRNGPRFCLFRWHLRCPNGTHGRLASRNCTQIRLYGLRAVPLTTAGAARAPVSAKQKGPRAPERRFYSIFAVRPLRCSKNGASSYVRDSGKMEMTRAFLCVFFNVSRFLSGIRAVFLCISDPRFATAPPYISVVSAAHCTTSSF